MPNALRKASVKGSFYPNTCTEINAYLDIFNREFDKHTIPKETRFIVPRAILVPHAGYVYSGFTANFAYRFLENAQPKRIVVIGPSHRYGFRGISGSFYDAFETPCGNIEIDNPYLTTLAKEFNIEFQEQAHRNEHSTEVQMPFIQHYFPNIPVIELVYGDFSPQKLSSIIVALLQNSDNVVVISSDLSHFYPLEEAHNHDNVCLTAVAKLDTTLIHQGCEACGNIGIEAMILASHSLKLQSKLLDYRTSATASGDEGSVVGYLSAMFYA